MTDSIHSDAASTVQVSARRFERSPFEDRWKTPETIMGVYAGRYYSTFNGENVEDAYWTLRRKAVLYDVPERPVEISGPAANPSPTVPWSAAIALGDSTTESGVRDTSTSKAVASSTAVCRNGQCIFTS